MGVTRKFKLQPILGLTIVLLVTTSLSFYGLKTLHDRDQADALLVHTYSVMDTIDQVTISAIDMERGFRGYLLTGQNAFLEPYASAKGAYETSLQALIKLSADNPAQEQRWHAVQSLGQMWITQWAEPGVLVRSQVNSGQLPPQKALDYEATAVGKGYLDAMRSVLDEGKQVESTLLAQREQAGAQANRLASDVTMGGILVTLLLGMSVGLLIATSTLKNSQEIELHHLLIAEREKERLQISRNLHDGPVQELIGAIYALQSLSEIQDDPKSAGQLGAIKASLQSQVSELRAYAMELRPPVLSKFGLEKAIRSHLHSFQQKHPGYTIEFDADPTQEVLPEPINVALFRIYQEAMNNILRHAQADKINLHLKIDPAQAYLEIADNGSGFQLPKEWVSMARQGHLGLVGIHERAAAVGGRVEIHSEPGGGTRLRVLVPLELHPKAEKDVVSKPSLD